MTTLHAPFDLADVQPVTYHLFRTYGRPLVLREIGGIVNGYINTSTDRNFKAIDPTTLHFLAPGIDQEYYNSLVQPNSYHGPAHRVINACGTPILEHGIEVQPMA